MARKTKVAKSTTTPKQKIVIERTFKAPLEQVWDLWTTKEGLESWWGPEGFTAPHRKFDLRPGGGYEYTMTATGPAQVEAMKGAGLPLTSDVRGTYKEVTPRRRLAFTTWIDFIAGVEPYEVATVVDFHATTDAVRLLITEDALHDEQWTKMSQMGMSSSLDKLAKILEA